MNPEKTTSEITEVSKDTHPIFKTTKLSKYLAMAIFIIMPFFGGWVGYISAPEKIVEVERLTTEDHSVKENPSNNFVTIGQKIGNMVVTEISPYNSEHEYVGTENFKILLKGTQDIKGKYGYIVTEAGFKGYCIYDLSEETHSQIASLPIYSPQIGESEGGHGQYRKMLCIRNTDLAEEILGKGAKNVGLIIDNYELNSSSTEFSDWVDLVKVEWFSPLLDAPIINPQETVTAAEFKASFLGGSIPSSWHEISLPDREYFEGKSLRYSISPNTISFSDISWDQVDFYLLAVGAADMLLKESSIMEDVAISSSTIGAVPVTKIQYPIYEGEVTKAGTGGTSYIIEIPNNQIKDESDPRHLLIVKQALAEEDFEKGFENYLETVDLSKLFQ